MKEDAANVLWPVEKQRQASLEIVEPANDPWTGLRTVPGEVLIGNHTSLTGILKASNRFLTPYYRLLNSCLKSHYIIIKASYLDLQFTVPRLPLASGIKILVQVS